MVDIQGSVVLLDLVDRDGYFPQLVVLIELALSDGYVAGCDSDIIEGEYGGLDYVAKMADADECRKT
jgi:hypothetical protein